MVASLMSSADNVRNMLGGSIPTTSLNQFNWVDQSVSLDQFLAEQNLPPVSFSVNSTTKNLDPIKKDSANQRNSQRKALTTLR